MFFFLNFLFIDGFMYLSIAIGSDLLIWNLQRRYGEKRIKLLLNEWKIEVNIEQK